MSLLEDSPLLQESQLALGDDGPLWNQRGLWVLLEIVMAQAYPLIV